LKRKPRRFSPQCGTLAAGRRDRIARHGNGPERVIQTGIGPVAVRRVKLRDRDGGESGVRFTSAILPRWSRRTRSLDALLSILYLRGRRHRGPVRGLSWRPSGETGLVPRLAIQARPGRRRALDDDLSRSLDAKASGRKGPKQFPLGYR
jgi:hypothetical protein